MKQKHFKHGTTKFARSYLKKVGSGWEAGLYLKTKKIFVGNFLHSAEANQWFSLMNKEITKFAKKYPVGERFPMQWFSKFAAHNLYSTYYKFLDRKFSTYTREYTRALKKDVSKYKKLRSNWKRNELKLFYKKAA